VIPNFEWDTTKAAANRFRHGVSFEEAASVFGDDDALIEDDPAHSSEEDRLIITGTSARERVLLTVYTLRNEDNVRIISSRPALPREKRTYEEKRQHRRG
jgi:uncharacterized DUF497 family protein